MNKKTILIVAIIVILIVAGGVFYGGMVYGKRHPVIRPGAPLNNGTKFGKNSESAGGAGFISGDIISKDSASITIQLPNNTGSKIIFYSNATQINKNTSGTFDDLATGTAVSVTGTTNSDGSVTAQSIQIRPAGQTNRPGQLNPGQ